MNEFMVELIVFTLLIFLIIFFTGIFGFGKRNKNTEKSCDEPPPVPTEESKIKPKGTHRFRKRIRVCIRKKKRKLKRMLKRR